MREALHPRARRGFLSLRADERRAFPPRARSDASVVFPLPRSPPPPPGFPHLRLALRAFAVVEVIQALVDSVAGLVKKHFDEARVFEHYGMICLALDEIVSDGVAEATSWDAIRRGIKLKMSS